MGSDPISTKEKLFFAGVKVFANKGYKGATVREICKVAGSGNMNAVNYHFGGKAELYRTILEVMFAELGNRMRAMGSTDSSADPEKRLCDVIRAYCAMLYTGGEIAAEFLAIYKNETAHPSPYLDELVDAYVVPQNRDILEIIAQIFGNNPPFRLLQDCAMSVFSQVVYYSTTWNIYCRIDPDHPGMEAYQEHLADHVCRFSLAGLKEVKRAFEAGEPDQPYETRNPS